MATEPLNKTVEIAPQEGLSDKLIAPGHDFVSVTNKIRFSIILFSYTPPANTLKGRNPHLRRAGIGFRISGRRVTQETI